MGIALSTAGVTVGYAVETVKGTRPVSGYKLIPDIKEVPEMNPEPETLETTTLAETEFKTYIEGLKDLGGALAFTANYTTEVETVWAELVEEYKTAIDSGLSTWFEIKHPKLDKSVFFTGQPSAMGLPAMSVNSVRNKSLHYTNFCSAERSKIN
jgi:hypothetical protein